MKKIAAVILAALTTLCLAGCSSDKSESAPNGMQTVIAGSDSDINFYCPKNWTPTPAAGTASAYASDGASVTVNTWTLDNYKTTVAEWWEKNLEETKQVFSDVTFIEDECKTDVPLGDANSNVYVYTASVGEGSYKIMQVAAIRYGMVCLVTYTTAAAKVTNDDGTTSLSYKMYDDHIDEVNDQILKNLSFN